MPPEHCAGANTSQTAGEDPTDLRPDGAGLWEDRPCSERHPFMCAVDDSPQYKPITTSTGYTFRWVPPTLQLPSPPALPMSTKQA
jgi:hypothetical protein